jgi:arylsulfatase A-like enzyme
MYRDIALDEPRLGSWTIPFEELPYTLYANYSRGRHFSREHIRAAHRAFYALCTHIDHQLRILIGTLREEALLADTIICFTSDHGDMLGNHGMWAKRLFYEYSANIPMILVGAGGDDRVGYNRVDHRLVGWQDVMPTLLDLAGVDIPKTVEGLSMVGEQKRDWLYGEVGEDDHATRMIHDGRYKLIYYPVGNYRQLFDLETDPEEFTNLAASPDHAEILARLTGLLIDQLYGGDEAWVQNGQLVGREDRPFVPGPNKGLSSQRGLHWPPPPRTDMPQIEWHVEAKSKE